MQGVTDVLQRINIIEQKFKISSNANGANVNVASSTPEFSKVLANTQQKSLTTEKQFASNDIRKMIEFSSSQYGVDPKLVMAVAQVESNFSPDVISPAGAVGVMQLMPDTAKGLGVRNSKDPRDNIDGGVRYLKELLNTFHGDTMKTIAAYNAGPQAVKTYNGTPPYPETRDYVDKVMAQYKSF